MKNFKTVLSVILSFALFFLLTIMAFFLSVQINFSTSSIDVNAAEITEEDINILASGNSNYIHQIYDEEIRKNGYPTEVLDYVLANSSYQDVISKLQQDYVKYVNGQGEFPTIDQSLISNVLNESITEYNKNVPQEEQISYDKVDEVSSVLTEQSNKVIKKFTDNAPVKKAIKFIYSKTNLYLSIIGVLITIILLFILKKKSSFKYIYIPMIISGIGLGIAYLVLKFSPISFAEQLLGNAYKSICSNVLLYTCLYVVVSIIFIVIQIVLKRKEREGE